MRDCEGQGVKALLAFVRVAQSLAGDAHPTAQGLSQYQWVMQTFVW